MNRFNERFAELPGGVLVEGQYLEGSDLSLVGAIGDGTVGPADGTVGPAKVARSEAVVPALGDSLLPADGEANDAAEFSAVAIGDLIDQFLAEPDRSSGSDDGAQTSDNVTTPLLNWHFATDASANEHNGRLGVQEDTFVVPVTIGQGPANVAIASGAGKYSKDIPNSVDISAPVVGPDGDGDSYPQINATTNSSSTTNAAKPVGTIAQLADYLINGFWQYNGTIAHHWASTTISYNISALTPAEKTLALAAFNAWHEVTNLTFVASSNANITFNHNGQLTAFETDNYNASGIMSSATVDISADWITTDGGANDGKTGIDSYGYQTYIHEIGHALGLGHQGPYNGSANYSTGAAYADDTWQYSVMSYFSEQNYNGGSSRYVITPQMADIYAVDAIYGAASTRTGNTVYGFHNTAGSIFDFTAYAQAPALTIYDSGGSDTLDCSGYSAAQTIDLHAGSFSSVGGLVHNIGIATNTVIETAIGGSGNDVLIANDLGCFLIGGAGNDRLNAGAGVDVLTGGIGADTFAFLTGGSSAAAGQHDVITDFASGTDKIDLTGFDAIAGTLAIDLFEFLGASSFDGIAGALNYIFDSARGVTVLQGDTNGDRVADFAIDLSGNIHLAFADLLGAFVRTTIESAGSTSLSLAASHYYLLDSGGVGPSLKYLGSDFVTGQLGTWTPIGAEQTGSGYEVAWKAGGADQYTVWSTDSAGNYTGHLLGAVSGNDQALQAIETSFHQDLNGDGAIGAPAVVATAVESAGSTSLSLAASHYYLLDSGGVGPSLKYLGSDFVTGQLGTWTPIGAEQTGSGYEVAWKAGGADQYTVWSTDSAGNYIANLLGAVSGGDHTLQAIETSFHQDLNGDGAIGAPAVAPPTVPSGSTIESAGSTSLSLAASHYYLLDSGGVGPSLKYLGSDFVTGQLGTWTPIGAEQIGSGYEVAWKAGGADQYTVWSTDSAGNYSANLLGAVSGGDRTLQAIETSFHQDLNGDGAIGAPAVAPPTVPSGSTIESAGSTSLSLAASHYYLLDSGGVGPSLKYLGSDFVTGQLGTWTPIGAEQTGSGYEVAWKAGGADQYTVWSTDSAGNYIANLLGAVSGGDHTLQAIETSFHQDLNGDGAIGAPAVAPPTVPSGSTIESAGSTSLSLAASHYYLLDSGGVGPSLKYLGSDFVTGQLGTWTPIGAEQTGSGYEVAWKAGGADQYTVWSTDSAGNYIANLLGAVSGGDHTLQAIETSFHQDLNGDGAIGAPAVVATAVESAGSTSLSLAASHYYLLDSGGVGPSLKYLGSDFVTGQLGTWTPIGAEQTGSGYEVAWKAGGADQYTVWSTDSAGNYSGHLLGAVSGNDHALQTIETSFHQDLNGDGVIGVHAASLEGIQNVFDGAFINSTNGTATGAGSDSFVFNAVVNTQIADPQHDPIVPSLAAVSDYASLISLVGNESYGNAAVIADGHGDVAVQSVVPGTLLHLNDAHLV